MGGGGRRRGHPPAHPNPAIADDRRRRGPGRDRNDTVAQGVGWQIPAWYTQLKTTTVPILGSATAMAAARSVGGP